MNSTKLPWVERIRVLTTKLSDMKKWKILTVVFMIGFASTITAQRGHNHRHDRHNDGRYYNTHHNDRYQYNGSYDVRYSDRHLNRRERRKVQRLRQDLDRCYERAWRDGRISRREARKIRQLESEIAQYYPRRRDYRRSTYTYRYNRRGTCG